MSDERCLYTLLYAPKENHEALLRGFVAPIVREVSASASLDSLFFARYSDPRWQLRFRILGDPDWVEGPVRARVRAGLTPLRDGGSIEEVTFARYEREYERYGGEEGMRLAEKVFLHDTIACLDLIEAEANGLSSKSRREMSLLMSERIADMMGFEGASRLAYYEHGFGWAIERKTWEADELRTLSARYGDLKEGLADLLFGTQSADPVAAWGGEEPARIAERWMKATRPVIDEILAGHRAGRVRQDLGYLAWSYAHMSCNRLGIDPAAEAILRFFVHRLHEDRAAGRL
jgi:thiopeptide-type bacteriocin biosynthesis protein